MPNPYDVVRQFEQAVADYTGSPCAVSVESCTAALFLCCKYLNVQSEVTIPSRTYVSVPCSIIHAGGRVKFEDIEWKGIYQLKPLPIYDAAKRFTTNMYIPGSFMCLSFHSKKHLKIGRGGMILTDNKNAVEWFKMARFDGRHEVPLTQDHFTMVGWNMYMTPEQAARGLVLLSMLPKHNEDQDENPPYPDLSKYEIFRT